MAGLIYVADMPSITFNAGNLELTLSSGGDMFRFVLTRHVGMALERKIAKAFSDERQEPDPVIPLCELCVRHNLPKSTKGSH